MKTKSYLALKGVNKDGQSAFITHPKLVTTYTIGKRVDCVHPNFPFYLATPEDIVGFRNTKLAIATYYDHIILVSVLAKDLRKKVPFNYGSQDDIFEKTNTQVNMSESYLGAVSLLPLVIMLPHVNLKQQLTYYAAKYHQKVLTPDVRKMLD